MAKSFFGIILFFIIGINCVYAMDLIILKDGNTIESRVVEISPAEIRYRRINHLDGPIIVVPAANVLSIRYQNGRVDIISSSGASAPATAMQSNNQTNNVQTGGASAVPQLGQPTLLQQSLNLLPAIPIAGNNLKFEFGGDTWFAKRNGRNLLAGSFLAEDTEEGNVRITLKQTHTYPPRDIPRINWIRTPGPELILDYSPGPPASLKFVGRSQGSAETAERRNRSNRDAGREGADEFDAAANNLFPKNSLTAEHGFTGIGGIGVNYERSLTNFFSLGGSIFCDHFLINEIFEYSSYLEFREFGLLATSRLYAGNSPFYFGLGLGYGRILGEETYHALNYFFYDFYDFYNPSIFMYYVEEIGIYSVTGFMMNPAIGLKFGRKTKGLVADISLSYPMVLGSKNWVWAWRTSGDPKGNFTIGKFPRFAIGLGGTW